MVYEAIVMGVSAGGIEALSLILPALSAPFPLPIAIVQHRDERGDGYLSQHLNSLSQITVKEAEDKEPLASGHAYIAPAGYHMLIEPDHSLALSVDPKVNYARPSIDVLFESAADAYGDTLIGVILTGANFDGAQGLKAIKARGGLCIVQDPLTAQVETMPKAALAATLVDHVVPLPEIASLLGRLSKTVRNSHGSNR